MKRSITPFVVTALVMVFFYLPIIVLVVNSFNSARFGGRWEGWSLRWYRSLFEHAAIWEALRNSLVIGFAATIVSVVIGTTAAIALHRYKTKLQALHYVFIYTPLVIPEILMGMGLLLFFVAIRMDLGFMTIFIAHVTFCISYVAMVLLGRLQDFDFSVVEAARDLGANWYVTTFKVMLPILMPGILSGALLAFTLSIDDFVVTFFVAGPGSTTLPIRIYSMIKYGSPPLINALSTVMLVCTFLAVLVSQRIMEKRQ